MNKSETKILRHLAHLSFQRCPTVFTLGICYPWACCMVYNWEVKHTVIDGRRLRFEGTAMGLFGSWIKWFLLSIITLGIYSFWLNIKLKQWKTKHTHFADTV